MRTNLRMHLRREIPALFEPPDDPPRQTASAGS
jgi:hypothetical protein